ncbi:hypothetical protein [uncultured Roseobacter sp.]|uniref:hypothetical protein n=1 Tax=uncultured Roseobacter sp. TaxID=114847 RepID=UPI0026286015|nr:hypothetical protein [uncultured Roseobacter sp.]
MTRDRGWAERNDPKQVSTRQGRQKACSERDPLQSTALVVLRTEGLKDVDLRIDVPADLLAALKALPSNWLSKSEGYRQRAFDPDWAPSSSETERK